MAIETTALSKKSMEISVEKHLDWYYQILSPVVDSNDRALMYMLLYIKKKIHFIIILHVCKYHENHYYRHLYLCVNNTGNVIHSLISPFSLDSNFYSTQTSPRRRSPYDGISSLIFLHVFCVSYALHMYKHASVLNFCSSEINAPLLIFLL